MQIKELKYYANIPYNWKKVSEIWNLVLPKKKTTALALKKRLQTCWPVLKFPWQCPDFLKLSKSPWHFSKLMKHIALDKRRYQVNSFSYFPMKNMWVLIKINLIP